MHEILPKVLPARITDRETFRPLFHPVYSPAGGERAAAVIVLADGARWIWGMGEEVLAHARQILDCSPGKPSLWEAGKLSSGAGPASLTPWVKAQETCLLEGKVEQGLTRLERVLDLAPALAAILHDFRPNAGRLRYGSYRQRGYFIGSGASERAGTQLSAARIKGPGMRWNIAELNLLKSVP